MPKEHARAHARWTCAPVGATTLSRVICGVVKERGAHDVRLRVSKKHDPRTTRPAEDRNTHKQDETPDAAEPSNTRMTRHSLPDACDQHQPKGAKATDRSQSISQCIGGIVPVAHTFLLLYLAL